MVEEAKMRKQAAFVLAMAVLFVVTPLASESAFAGLLAAQPQDIVDQVSQTTYRHYLDDVLYTHLGDDRQWGPEHDLAQSNIYAEFEGFGLNTSLHPFEYKGSTFYNVVGVHYGIVRPDNIYILGAHYDSKNGPGADDNASGTAGVMEAARVLSQYQFEATLVFIAFDREEQGLNGSRAYAQDHKDDDTLGMISLDMIAYNGSGLNEALIYGLDSSAPLKEALAEAIFLYGNGLSSIDIDSNIIGVIIGDVSDHESFEHEGFQACLLSEWLGNPYNHSPMDSVDMPNYIDYAFATNMVRSAVGFLATSAVLIPEPATFLLPDFNGDGKVDLKDFSKLAEYWLQDESSVDISPPPNGDGIVDIQDLAIFAEYWLKDFRLIAHWKLDETEGTIGYDNIGDNDGTLNGNPLWQPIGGKVDGALEFDGIDDYVSIDFVLNPAEGAFSVFSWIKGGAPGQVIISQRDTTIGGTTHPGSAWLCARASDGRLMTGLMATVFRPLVSESVITDGQWHHIGLVYDFDGLYRYLYVDGAEVAEDTNVVGGVHSDGGLYFGAGKYLAAADFWSGLIDDVRIYNRVLSAEDIEALAR